MTPLSPRTRSALLVAALHALLLRGMGSLPLWQQADPPALAQAPLIVWLQGAPRPDVAAAPAAAARPALPPAARTLPSPARAPASPQAITLPAPAFSPPPVSAPSPPAHAAAPPAPASAALNLALPRGASAPWRRANPALEAAQDGPRPATLESRIAALLGGSDQISEFRQADGSVRLKRGNSCVVVRPNRASALDPFNASTQLRPRLIDSC